MALTKIDIKAMQDKFRGCSAQYNLKYMNAIASSLGYVYVSDWFWSADKNKLVRKYIVKTGMITKEFKTAKEAGQWLETTILDINMFASSK